jgi:putative DNA primase/helicase
MKDKEATPCQDEISHALENRPTAAAWWKEFVEQRAWRKLTPDGVNLLKYGVSPRWPADGEFDDNTLILGIDVNLGEGAIERIGGFLDATQELWPFDLWRVYHIEWEPWEREKPPPIEVQNTDQGNAVRLVYRHGPDLSYCHPWKKWLIWGGRRWRVDDTAEVMRRAKETIRSIYAEAAEAADEKERKDLAKHALRSESEPCIRRTIKLAESEPGIPVLPNELDADPWLLTCLNGTLDLRTGELREHRREDRITKLAPVEYDPEATAPTWDAFLQRIMDGKKDLIAFLQRAVGYSLSGDVSERVLFFLYGRGANGKSTFLETVRALLGDYAQRTPTKTLLTKRSGSIPNDIARLRGARFVSASESEEGKRLNEPLIKELTGGDTMCARFLHAEFFEFKPKCKFWLATNHKPIVHGTDKAIWDRIKLIPFTVTIPESEQDKHLVEKLKTELLGILAWAVRGCLDWQENGLGVPSEVKKATESYRDEMDILGDFIKNCCVVAPTAVVGSKEFNETYGKWCEENGERPLSQKKVGTQLRERGFTKDRNCKTGRIEWYGLGLLSEPSEPNGRFFQNTPDTIEKKPEKGSEGSMVQDDPLVQAAMDSGGEVGTVKYIEYEGEKVPF